MEELGDGIEKYENNILRSTILAGKRTIKGKLQSYSSFLATIADFKLNLAGLWGQLTPTDGRGLLNNS